MCHALLIILLLWLPPASAAALQQLLDAQQLTGAVWSTVTPEHGIATGAAGLAHAGTRQPMRADARVQVGSVSKTALALGVLRLVSEGRLTLDTPVAPLLPALPFDNPWRHTDPVRVRHLLAHTAGLENSRLWQVFSLDARADTPLSAAFARQPSVLTSQTRPGSHYAYSNIGYNVLGMLIETVSGQRYDRYLDAAVLRPLGMRDSTFGFVTQAQDARLAMGHFERGARQAATRHYLPAADQFTTTAADMGRLAQFLMGDGSLDGKPFIAPVLMEMAALGAPAGTDAAKAGLHVGHGLALAARDRNGQVGYCHPGTTIGFNAMLCVYPQHRKAFFVATNTDSETADYEQLNQHVLSALALPPAAIVTRAAPAADIADWQGVYAPLLHRMQPLAWTDVVFNFMRADWDGGTLRLAPFQGKARALLPSGGHLFTMPGRVTHSHVLLQDDAGARIISDGLHSYRRIGMPLLAALWASLALGLLGMLYILLTGGWRLLRGRLAPSQALFPPLLGVAALALPVPLFVWQSFMRMGELTLASGALAAVTAALPLLLVVGLLRHRHGRRRDTLAICAALQSTLVLAAWGMLPFMLWK